MDGPDSHGDGGGPGEGFPGDWVPGQAGVEVRLIDNPGLCGITTGQVRDGRNRVLVEVLFSREGKRWKAFELLERCGGEATPFDLARAGRFGLPSDLYRLLVNSKVQGDLTNIFYSMAGGNTEFYAHQFRPVLKFIESPHGRLLIADEVGLGKTIEAVYIWLELQVRDGARRLLVVCPSMLREKWQGDLRVRFGIEADIVDAPALLRKLRGDDRGLDTAFTLITSLEGIRPPKGFENEALRGDRAELGRLLHAHGPENPLLDLTVIDEAHYLRNPSTASHRLGTLLRDASANLLLLTATPVQLHDENLFHLLRLVDPDTLINLDSFKEILEANKPVVNALRHLWSQPPAVGLALENLAAAGKNRFFRADPRLQRVREEILALDPSDHAGRVRTGRLLENLSLAGQYMTRTRKRDVLANRVLRSAQVLEVGFSRAERTVYEAVTQRIREASSGRSGPSLFHLVARQRQMASCMAAALQGWNDSGFLAELFWEDFGLAPEDREEDDPGPESADALDAWLEGTLASGEFDVAELERNDTKYQALVTFLRPLFAEHPGEKVVLFAFFRGTLAYLERRLRRDGISSILLMGGMGDEKYEVLRTFARPDGPSVLLSSEVGSEGIDLQFCRTLVNYDLPWNPMRVEQRIGRLDRLGQAAERISIVSFVLGDSVEERILKRLYERIHIFRESIGDLEEILGQVTQDLLTSLFDPELSDAEREHRAEATILALERNRVERNELEEHAINMMAFSDYLLRTVADDRETGRWLQPAELRFLVDDFFRRHHPACVMTPSADHPWQWDITLSHEARVDLHVYLQSRRPTVQTRLHRATTPVSCLFSLKDPPTRSHTMERITAIHPLILWIRHHYAENPEQLLPVASARLDTREAREEAGLYAYCIHSWRFEGIRTEKRLVFLARHLESGTFLSPDASERLVFRAVTHGRSILNPDAVTIDLDGLADLASSCEERLVQDYLDARLSFQAENENRCRVQEQSARAYYERKQNYLLGLLDRFRAEGSDRMVRLTEGRLRPVVHDLDVKLKQIADHRVTKSDDGFLGIGVIEVSG
ncbi:MAG: DNA/RNA helicase, superfamily II, SNF2 family protein [Acidobacteria bacterium]|nr:DNA/RNA helicase, superfamily II, SNF2 family protein [Acidobacteriota bacterium]